MNRNKKLLGILLVAIVSVFFATCGGGTSHADTVYYLNHRDGDGFTDLIRDSFAAKAKDAGVAVEFRDAIKAQYRHPARDAIDGGGTAVAHECYPIVFAERGNMEVQCLIEFFLRFH
ncbi:hypothetical protein SAMN04487861_12710 [Selenomonas ruminantium]|uniref:Uncharacterized protein n=1 Tax=Selenomonas ruminantium TaxID=971 RepID=A0A1I3H436_SELRU|nr:hypothetical protein [Selenomonas ruminantium]SFI30464.1 hypothetical protein SAMN04487861_12710 [Selenomonas ruminantium]